MTIGFPAAVPQNEMEIEQNNSHRRPCIDFVRKEMILLSGVGHEPNGIRQQESRSTQLRTGRYWSNDFRKYILYVIALGKRKFCSAKMMNEKICGNTEQTF